MLENGDDSMPKMKKWIEKYDEINGLGKGGNADVYLVCDKLEGKEYALKELRNRNEEKKIRFLNEIQIAEENSQSIPGIIPVIDCDKEQFWYTMPIATPIMSFIRDKDIKEIIEGVIQLAETLESLHDKRIYHRDIKPSNIYYYEGRFSFGDFGLVDFPDNLDLTQTDKGLGAIFTIAPEMKRNPKQADASKADIYSLAKTMWMFLSKDEKGFDGVYNYLDVSHSLRNISCYTSVHLVELDQLIKDATENDPNLRPNIHEFEERLRMWIDIYNDKDKSQNSDWIFLTKQIFGENVPSSATWRNSKEIINVLNIIGATPAYNHMMFSDKGGLDFSRSESAPEKDCIYVYDTLGMCFLVKPKNLSFEGFNDDFRWSYFLLDLKEMEPIIRKYDGIGYENLVEDRPGHYVHSKYAVYGVYDYDTGEKLPEGFKTVCRYLYGKFLIVLKTGPYNKINGTYDGRHGMCNNSQFRDYIEKIKEIYTKMREKAKDDMNYREYSDDELDRMILNQKVFNYNPFEVEEKDYADDMEAIEKSNQLIKERTAYIERNCFSWNYIDAIRQDQGKHNCKIKFRFRINLVENSLTSFFEEDKLFLSKHGCFRKNSGEEDDIYYVYSREDAIKTYNELTKVFYYNIESNGYTSADIYHEYFDIELIRNGKPSHLFTKDEIEIQMRNADDRINNVLVIDEDGYAHVVEFNEAIYLYPVRHESWQAGNIYVGKYSSLATLEDDYISSLQGWLDYLTYGKHVYMDYVRDNNNEEILLSEIRKFY